MFNLKQSSQSGMPKRFFFENARDAVGAGIS